ncbi:hypothetical protein QVD17_22672 [Tagetes erecta]|uniref:Secreted protein n=1 Tax=Tagetes erecta TaxID=13708 RepID=A0AAD8KD74_TARER|nr:hypothetical protein QVD17_22672 [Tagetes erecta]
MDHCIHSAFSLWPLLLLASILSEASKEYSGLSVSCLEEDGRECSHPLFLSCIIHQQQSEGVAAIGFTI